MLDFCDTYSDTNLCLTNIKIYYKKIIDLKVDLKLYSVNNITSGTDAQGEVTVRVVKGDLIVNGHGADTDIVKASVLAYLNAINKIYQNPDLDSKKLSGI